MEAVLKWIGGASVAVVLALAGTTLASDWMAEEDVPPSLEQSIPVDAAKLAPAARPPLGQGSGTEPQERFVLKRILPIDGPIKYGEWHWDEEGAPAEGPVVMTVDLDARVLSVFRDGYEIGAAAVLLGTDDYPTPLGTFPILAKQRHNVSEKYGNAPMPWSMFLTRDGVAIHGGSVVENGYASHGCIAGPDDFVSKIFAIAKPGDKVVITRGETLQLGQPII